MALTFELSKVQTPAIRERMVAHLLNIDETLATTVAQKLGFKSMPKAANAAVPTRQDLEPSPALSIVEKRPKRFEGRKLGILVTDGVDAKLLKGLTTAVTKANAVYVSRRPSGENHMKKLAIGAIAAVFATLSLSSVADARPNWHHGGNHGGWHRGWNHSHWRGGWHHGWRRGGWHRGYWGGWHGGYWGGPRLVIGVGPGACFVKKVRHYHHGEVSVTRVRVCR